MSDTEKSGTEATLAGRTVLVTGANRGIGKALVEEALRRGAQRVYAGTRRPLTHPDARVTALALDITDDEQVREVARTVGELDVLVNNAGLSAADDLDDRAVLERHLAVNLFGTRAVTLALLPHLARSRGTVVNVLSVAAVAALPVLPAYSISKAAALSFTQSLRATVAAQGVGVHAVLAGPVDTDMSRDLDVPKAAPAAVARAIFDGVARGDEEIFPDPLAAALEPGWESGPIKVLERMNAALLAELAASA
jgi:NAD(P)-dependent dehydrogenase (short-subunit alcohol dehydrogenase family)